MSDSTANATQPKKKPLYARPKFIINCIVVLLFLFLMYQNWASVTINVFFAEDIRVPASLAYIAFAILGFAAGWLMRMSKSKAKPKETQK